VTVRSDDFDFVVIGAGAAGEAALELAAARGQRVAVVERDLFGGSCTYWACMPSKALLHAAAVHAAGGEFPWDRASAFRDWMINREDVDYPTDASHEQRYESIGVEPIRGTARLDGPGIIRVELREGGPVRDRDVLDEGTWLRGQLAPHDVAERLGRTLARLPPPPGGEQRPMEHRGGSSLLRGQVNVAG